MKSIKKFVAIRLLLIAALMWGGALLFNHINPWMGILAEMIAVYTIIATIINLFEKFNKTDNEKD